MACKWLLRGANKENEPQAHFSKPKMHLQPIADFQKRNKKMPGFEKIDDLEKQAVIAFILFAIMSFASIVYPTSPFSWIPQNIYIPLLNIIAGLKVTIGAWSIIRLFINKRGII